MCVMSSPRLKPGDSTILISDKKDGAAKRPPSKIEKFANFISKNYSYMVLTTTLLGIICGFSAPVQVQSLKPYMSPLISVMVYAMTVTIKFSELAQAPKKFKQITLGMILNFGLLPAICFLLAVAFLSSKPTWAVGFILMGTVPCAGMCVVWTGLLKGDVSLALIIGALTMILGAVTIPGLTALLAGVYVSVNVLDLLLYIVTMLAIPLILGILTRQVLEAKLGKSVEKYLPIFPPASAVTAMILMFSMLAINMIMVPGDLSAIALLVIPPLIVFPVAFGCAHLICSKILHLPLRESVAIVYSSGMKHLPLASFGPPAALPIAISAAFQTVNAGIFYRIFQRIGDSST